MNKVEMERPRVGKEGAFVSWRCRCVIEEVPRRVVV
ncbi:hypothetical protein E2C01_090531 [Portunus trituberculatus]|uniref:Uncharacterized protein n=1 Tax=Portunus trituberculatus TaxID=210409 RepID=A0A5B7JSN5_PORTR|nr:hypothetical protein [Portunus trituberculatus]